MKESDNVLINVQIPRTTRDDFRIAAKQRSQSMSALIIHFIVKTIREEKARTPEAFPDYGYDRPAVAGTEIDEILYDAFDGRAIDPAELKRMMRDAKEMTRIREIVDQDKVRKAEQ